ncbi:hypothetical protein [Rhodococcus sp. (in: high G+C Gram-positive bacteria)]|uniref:hypothetical protein n=1 Tax=Rhodococcus sp. TaxID=1831 RepID=UPI003315AA75
MSAIRSQATPARDELVHILAGAVLDNPGGIGTLPPHAADGIIAAGWSKPHTVNSAAELDALPNMTVVMDNCDDVSQKRGGQWCGYETADLTSKQIAKYGPLTVLFTPREAG